MFGDSIHTFNGAEFRIQNVLDGGSRPGISVDTLTELVMTSGGRSLSAGDESSLIVAQHILAGRPDEISDELMAAATLRLLDALVNKRPEELLNVAKQLNQTSLTSIRFVAQSLVDVFVENQGGRIVRDGAVSESIIGAYEKLEANKKESRVKRSIKALLGTDKVHF